MKTMVRTKGIDLTEALENFVEARGTNFVSKYFIDDENVELHSRLKVVKEEHIAEITIFFHSYVLRGEANTEDMYNSIDMALSKIEVQYKKHKDRMGRKNSKITGLKNAGEVVSKTEELEELEIIRRKKFGVKPMGEEEAILQMDLLGHNFFVYLDETTDSINVVYKRKRGKYGIIETER